MLSRAQCHGSHLKAAELRTLQIRLDPEDVTALVDEADTVAERWLAADANDALAQQVCQAYNWHWYRLGSSSAHLHSQLCAGVRVRCMSTMEFYELPRQHRIDVKMPDEPAFRVVCASQRSASVATQTCERLTCR